MDTEFWGEVFTTPGLRTWLRIMIWVYVFTALFVFTRLLKGGFSDLSEIAVSRYATARERWDARFKYPGRFVLLVFASALGAAGFAITVFIQGAVALFFWNAFIAG